MAIDFTAKLKDLLNQPMISKQDQIAEMAGKYLKQRFAKNSTPNFGLRPDGTPKGNGFLGALKRPDGKVSSEISIGVNFDGKEILIPLLIPTLTQDEVNKLLSVPLGTPETMKNIPREIIDKAVEHAKGRISQGLSPFND